jgi:hypothetical protein
MGMKVNGSSGLVFPDSTTMTTGSQAVRAWVNFNGTGTVAIRASFNVSSITDNGTGDYTVNFTTAMPDANYAPTLKFGNTTMIGYSYIAGGQIFLSTSYRFATGLDLAAAPFDSPVVAVAIFR